MKARTVHLVPCDAFGVHGADARPLCQNDWELIPHIQRQLRDDVIIGSQEVLGAFALCCACRVGARVLLREDETHPLHVHELSKRWREATLDHVLVGFAAGAPKLRAARCKKDATHSTLKALLSRR
jgi:hypothetical protein